MRRLHAYDIHDGLKWHDYEKEPPVKDKYVIAEICDMPPLNIMMVTGYALFRIDKKNLPLRVLRYVYVENLKEHIKGKRPNGQIYTFCGSTPSAGDNGVH